MENKISKNSKKIMTKKYKILPNIKSYHTDDMILYIENPKDATKKLLELINEFGKVAGYKTNAQKSLAFLYTNGEKSEREIKETLPFYDCNKKNKIPRNKPT